MKAEQRKLYELKAELIQAAGHPIRLAVIDLLADGEQCVCDIAKHVSAERSNVSRHLAILLKAGIVETRKDGLKVMYSLKTPCITNFLSCATEALRQRIKSENVLLRNL
jgi:DNA-binding transcriptional ArsR family regulator